MDTAKDETNRGYLSAEELETGGVYRLRSRNLDFGVFDGQRGFIGIREKFGSRYLDTEYNLHTARAVEQVGTIGPDVLITESPGRKCQACGGWVKCLEGEAGNAGAKWREYHIDANGVPLESEPDHEIISVFVSNDALFAALETFEAAATSTG
jgi:hypothetical protein